MPRYRPLKYSNSNISMQCPNCGWYLVTKDGKNWFCKRCRSRGRVEDLYKKENSENKPKLSEEWKKLTGEKDT